MSQAGWVALDLLVAAVLDGPVCAAGAHLVGVVPERWRFRNDTDYLRRVVTNEIGRLRSARCGGEAQGIIDAREEILRIVAHDLRNPLNTTTWRRSYPSTPPGPMQREGSQLPHHTRTCGRADESLDPDLLSVTYDRSGPGAVDRPSESAVAELLYEARG